MISKTAVIHTEAKLSPDCKVGEYSVIEAGVVLGPGVELGHHVIIHAQTRLGAGTTVADGAILGRAPRPAASSTTVKKELKPLEIGENCIIGSGVVVYRGTEIGDACFLGDYASIREESRLGESVLVGQRVVVENQVEIGSHTKIQTGAYITTFTKVDEQVFIAPMVTTTNDNYMGRTEKRFAERKGPHFQKGCRVGGGVTLLPGVTIGEESFIAAGSLVTKDLPGYQLAMGSPARARRAVPGEELLDPGKAVTHSQEGKTPVPGFDLKRQNAALQGEISRVLEQVISSGHFILGGQLVAIEAGIAKLCASKYGIGVANGSDALLLALLACDIGEGDEVITTPFTFFATAGSIVRAGATPVFADIDPQTYNLDPAQIEEKITTRTKAIMPVHLFGQSAKMDTIMEIAQAKGLKVIEDAAQAMGAEYQGKPVCSMGDVGCISFFPTKNLGCFGDGGMVVTNDDQIAERVRMLRVHGTQKKYYHELMGFNSRLDAMQAAVLNVKLPHFAKWIKGRQANAQLYDQLFQESGLVEGGQLKTPYQLSGALHTYNQYTIAAQRRDQLLGYLKKERIGTTVYYPLPLHLQPVFQDLGHRLGDFPHSEEAAEEVLSLPIFPELTEDEVRSVADAIIKFYGDESI